MPSNGHYYNALTIHAFKEAICDWIGLINDCYVLHAHSLDDQFLPFCSSIPVKKVNEPTKVYNLNLYRR